MSFVSKMNLFSVLSLISIFGSIHSNEEQNKTEAEVESGISLNTLCDKIDESVEFSDRKMYFFSDQYFWEIDKQFQFISAPTYVQNKWGFLVKTPLDAAFTFNWGRFQNKTIFIKDNQWWRVTADGQTEATNVISWEG